MACLGEGADPDEDWDWVSFDRDSVSSSSEEIPSPAGVLIREVPQAGSLPSTASSLSFKGSFLVTVMAKDGNPSFSTEQHCHSDWIEPQLVFSKSANVGPQSYELCKEAVVSLLSDPALWDAVRKNKCLQRLSSWGKDYETEQAVSCATACSNSGLNKFSVSSVLWKQTRKILKEKFLALANILFPLDTQPSVTKDLDKLVLLASVSLLIVIEKRLSSVTTEGYR